MAPPVTGNGVRRTLIEAYRATMTQCTASDPATPRDELRAGVTERPHVLRHLRKNRAPNVRCGPTVAKPASHVRLCATRCLSVEPRRRALSGDGNLWDRKGQM